MPVAREFRGVSLLADHHSDAVHRENETSCVIARSASDEAIQGPPVLSLDYPLRSQ